MANSPILASVLLTTALGIGTLSPTAAQSASGAVCNTTALPLG